MNTKLLSLYNISNIHKFLGSAYSLKYENEAVLLYQNNPAFCKIQLANYNTALYNAIIRSIVVDDNQKTLQYYSDYQSKIFEKLTGIDMDNYQYNLLILSIHIHNHKWDFTTAYNILSTNTALIHDYEKKIPPQIFKSSYFFLGLTMFGLQKTEQALEYWSSFYEDKTAYTRIYQIHAYYLRLLLLWDSQQWPVLLYRLEQTKRFLRKHSPNTLFIRLIYRFIRRSALQPQQAQQAISQFHHALSHYICDETVNPLKIFNYTRWAAQRLMIKP